MELNIIKQIKALKQMLRHKPTPVLEKPKPVPKPKKEKVKREQIKTVVNGRELTLSQIALFYKLEPHTVYARYRVGNRGKLLIRPSHRKST
jgi:hypothetical protein